MQILVTVDGFCPGENHVNMTLRSGPQVRLVSITLDDLLEQPAELSDVLATLIPLLRQRVLGSNANNNAQRRAAIESRPFHI